VRTPEWVAVAYFAYLLAAGLVLPLPSRSRRLLSAACAALVAFIVFLARLPASPVFGVCRDWLPGAYLIIGYWLSGLFFVRPDVAWEVRLARGDRWLFDALALGRFIRRAPRLLLELFELAYLCVYGLVPAGLAVLYLAGQRREADVFWTVVLIGTYLAYGALPWITTRPPRALEARSAIDDRQLWVRRLNLAVLDRASIQINTFPSGHAAGAVSAAAILARDVPAAGVVWGAIAAGIIAGSVLGRYHYALDALCGVLAAGVGLGVGMALAG
jgi:hypothetical protein